MRLKKTRVWEFGSTRIEIEPEVSQWISRLAGSYTDLATKEL